MSARIGTARISVREYDAILCRVRELGRSEETTAQIATEFNRGITTIRKLAGKLGR